MAITVTSGNPIKVTGDTAAAAKIVDASVPVLIKYIYWFNPTTAGQLCTLVTKDGSPIAELKCEGDGDAVHLGPLDVYVKDIYCSDMDSGTLYIYTK